MQIAKITRNLRFKNIRKVFPLSLQILFYYPQTKNKTLLASFQKLSCFYVPRLGVSKNKLSHEKLRQTGLGYIL